MEGEVGECVPLGLRGGLSAELFCEFHPSPFCGHSRGRHRSAQQGGVLRMFLTGSVAYAMVEYSYVSL